MIYFLNFLNAFYTHLVPTLWARCLFLTFWRRNYFFLILAHTVYKMWIIQEPNKLELWNKLHFEKEKAESMYHV